MAEEGLGQAGSGVGTSPPPAPGAAAGGGAAGAGSAPPASRPDGVPEKFWDAEAKAVRVDQVLRSYNELESMLGRQKETIRNEVLTEFDQARKVGVPESPEGYAFDVTKLEVPPHVKLNTAEDDPTMQWFRKTAHELGIKQSQFEKIVSGYLQTQVPLLPNPEVELTKLGENAQERLRIIDHNLLQRLPEENYHALMNEMTSAESIRAIELLLSQSPPDGPAGFDAMSMTPGNTEEQLRALMDDPRYWRDHNPEFIKRVEEGWKRLYG